MKKNRTRAWIFRLLTVIYVIGVAYLCFAHFDQIKDAPKTLLGMEADKVVHFCMFFPFPILAFLAYDRLTDSVLKAFAAILVIISIGGIFAGITEIVQGAMPYRTEDIRDFYADLYGLGTSSVMVFIADVAGVFRDRKKIKP